MTSLGKGGGGGGGGGGGPGFVDEGTGFSSADSIIGEYC